MRFITPIIFLLTGFTAALPAEPLIITTSLSASEYVASLNLTDPAVLEHLRANPLTCLTKSDSPLVTAIHAAANNLIAVYPASKLCVQSKQDAGVNVCDLKSAYNESEFYVCAKMGKNVRCHSVAWAAKHIANNCGKMSPAFGGEKIAEGIYWFAEAQVNVLVARRPW